MINKKASETVIYAQRNESLSSNSSYSNHSAYLTKSKIPLPKSSKVVNRKCETPRDIESISQRLQVTSLKQTQNSISIRDIFEYNHVYQQRQPSNYCNLSSTSVENTNDEPADNKPSNLIVNLEDLVKEEKCLNQISEYLTRKKSLKEL